MPQEKHLDITTMAQARFNKQRRATIQQKQNMGEQNTMSWELHIEYKLDPSNVKKEEYEKFSNDLNHFIAEHQYVFTEIHITRKCCNDQLHK